mgnify:CR=1 FL=1
MKKINQHSLERGNISLVAFFTYASSVVALTLGLYNFPKDLPSNLLSGLTSIIKLPVLSLVTLLITVVTILLVYLLPIADLNDLIQDLM